MGSVACSAARELTLARGESGYGTGMLSWGLGLRDVGLRIFYDIEMVDWGISAHLGALLQVREDRIGAGAAATAMNHNNNNCNNNSNNNNNDNNNNNNDRWRSSFNPKPKTLQHPLHNKNSQESPGEGFIDQKP